MDRLSFVIGGIGLECRSKGVLVRGDPRREVFAAFPGRSDVSLEVGEACLESRSSGRLVFDSGMVWSLYDEGDWDVFKFSSPSIGSAPYKELRLSKDCATGHVLLHRPYLVGEAVDPLEYPLDELLILNRLGKGLGCELHACGIVDEDGRGWVFCGHSGAGKSTLAGLLNERGVVVLSDDRIILRPAGHEVLMYGTPWHGEAGFAVASSAPLAGILVLSHGSSNQMAAMTRIEALSELMARAFVPFHDEGALTTALTTLNAALDVAETARFAFVPDRSAVDHMFAWMQEAGHV